jgi:hypothetical protein
LDADIWRSGGLEDVQRQELYLKFTKNDGSDLYLVVMDFYLEELSPREMLKASPKGRNGRGGDEVQPHIQNTMPPSFKIPRSPDYAYLYRQLRYNEILVSWQLVEGLL